MGAKRPVKLKLRRPLYKCDICSRKLLSTQALKTHKYSVHKIREEDSPPKTSVNAAATPKTVVKKVRGVITKVEKTENEEKPESEPSNYLDDERKMEKVSDLRKIQFECPICNDLFQAYFPAYRHIQKVHCLDSKGQKVEISADQKKPLRVEMCIKCHKRVRANDMHVCFETPLLDESGIGLQYLCTGCQQTFCSMQMFDMHVSGLHSDGVESLFFTDMNDFLAWKQEMQHKTKITYLILGKCNLKQTYRCTYLHPSETMGHSSTSQICPSSIVVQEYTKGIQVHFYKKHHGHVCLEYSCPEKFKKFLITSLMQEKSLETYDVSYDEKDLYCQLKVLLQSIIVESAKVKIDDLKLMLEKALEMTSILTNYDEDADDFTTSNTNVMIDDQISKALENIQKFAIKRKSTVRDENEDAKKTCVAKTVKSLSVINEGDKEAIDKEEKKTVKEDVPARRVLRNAQIQSPTFNDSYKDFVDKACKGGKPGTTAGPKTSGPKSKMKPGPDRIGKPKPPSKVVDQKEIEMELAKDIIQVPVLYPDANLKFKDAIEPQTNTNVKEVSFNLDNVKNGSPNKGKASPVNTKIVPMVTKTVTPKMKHKKIIMKTKVGQFRPNFGSKTSPVKPGLNKSIGKAKPDIEYEVMEQEDDCNILILKI